MINKSDDYAEFALLLDELSDANEHLDNLIQSADKDDFDEIDFRIQLAHVYSHLNRAWNRRNYTAEISAEVWDEFSEFPKDIGSLI